MAVEALLVIKKSGLKLTYLKNVLKYHKQSYILSQSAILNALVTQNRKR